MPCFSHFDFLIRAFVYFSLSFKIRHYRNFISHSVTFNFLFFYLNLLIVCLFISSILFYIHLFLSFIILSHFSDISFTYYFPYYCFTLFLSFFRFIQSFYYYLFQSSFLFFFFLLLFFRLVFFCFFPSSFTFFLLIFSCINCFFFFQLIISFIVERKKN